MMRKFYVTTMCGHYGVIRHYPVLLLNADVLPSASTSSSEVNLLVRVFIVLRVHGILFLLHIYSYFLSLYFYSYCVCVFCVCLCASFSD